MNKKLIRLTESDLHRIVRESVNKVLNEIGDTERGQYALGAVQARADMRKRDALNKAITYNLTSAHMKMHKHTQYAYSFPTIR